jgi:hypothetical protein
MAKATSFYVVVAKGQGAGGPWALLWPAWKWARLTDEERTAVIARQYELMVVDSGGQKDGKNGTTGAGETG